MKLTCPIRCPAHFVPTLPRDRGRQLVVAAAVAEDGAQVGLVEGEEAVPELPVGGDADAIAAAAERLGDARDHPHVALAVGVLEPLGRLDVARAGDRLALQREDRVDGVEDLASGDDAIHRPLPLRVERHELDEADADATGTPVRREVDDLVVVHAAHDDAVDLDRVEPGVERRVDPGEHALELVAAGERAERVGAERVERDVDPPQPAAARSCASSGSRTPFVVIARSVPRGASIVKNRARWARSVGSPPVTRIARNP